VLDGWIIFQLWLAVRLECIF